MPVIPPVPVAPYDTVDSCVVAARVAVLDAMQGTSGDTLKYDYPFTQVTVNSAWRQFKAYLQDQGYLRTRSEIVISNIPPAAVLDPAVQVNLSWNGYWDGASLWPQPALPFTFKSPLWVSERLSAQPFGFGGQMRCCLDGLPQNWKQVLNYYWEWREDAIWMPGATAATDLRIRFNLNLGDFQNLGDPTAGGVWWYNQPVPIVDCQQAFALFIAAAFAAPRSDPDAQSLLEKGMNQADLIFNRDVQMKQRVNATRKPFSATQRYGNWGGGGYQDF